MNSEPGTTLLHLNSEALAYDVNDMRFEARRVTEPGFNRDYREEYLKP